MEAVGDLDGLWRAFGCAFGIRASAITRNDADGGVLLEPGRECLRITVFEQRDRAVLFKVDNDGAVALAFFPGPVVNSNNFRRRWFGKRELAYEPQKGVAAGGAVEFATQVSTGSAAQGEANLLLLLRQ